MIFRTSQCAICDRSLFRVSSWPISFPKVNPSRVLMAGLPNGIHVCGVKAGQNGPWNVPAFPREIDLEGHPKLAEVVECRSWWLRIPFRRGATVGGAALEYSSESSWWKVSNPSTEYKKYSIEYRVNGHETCLNINPGYCCLPVLSEKPRRLWGGIGYLLPKPEVYLGMNRHRIPEMRFCLAVLTSVGRVLPCLDVQIV